MISHLIFSMIIGMFGAAVVTWIFGFRAMRWAERQSQGSGESAFNGCASILMLLVIVLGSFLGFFYIGWHNL